MTAARPVLLVLNGPNLGRLGSREPEIYGDADYAEVQRRCHAAAEEQGWTAQVRQSEDEAELVRWIHEACDGRIPVVINPAAFTHYSYALRDACAQHTAPLVEVHLSNPAARESFRQHSVLSAVADGTVAGFGIDSYTLGIRAAISLAERG